MHFDLSFVQNDNLRRQFKVPGLSPGPNRINTAGSIEKYSAQRSIRLVDHVDPDADRPVAFKYQVLTP
jgi:hypothetical protein